MLARTARLAAALASAFVLIASASVHAAGFPQDPPNDPMYAPTAGANLGPTGQWNLRSDNDNVPATLLTGGVSGISVDQAWQVTTGRPDVVVGVLDSGVNYDHEDLRNKIWLNRGELPVPTPPGGCPSAPVADPHDCNGDGVFNVLDYTGDPRVPDFNGDGAVDRGDFRPFADGIDTDGNGYVDDLSGWDTNDDDGDEFDHRYFGHGTGRAGIVAPETNNGKGVAGVCPGCPLMNIRIDDTFVCDSAGVAKGAIYATDMGARVFNMSLGCTTASRLSKTAFDYVTRHNVLAINAAANEFSFHQNFQSIFDDVMSIGAVTPNSTHATTTWLQKANFSNYGAHTDVIAPTVVPDVSMGELESGLPNDASYTSSASGTSTSTPHAVGVAALVFSRAHDLIDQALLPVGPLALKDLSAQEVRQIIDRTADDVTAANGTTYVVSPGWDKYTGYGRVNAKRAVDRVAATTIPPEADINAPDWYTLVDGAASVRFYTNARWASGYAYTLEVGQGVEPAAFTPLAAAVAQPSNPALSSANLVSNRSVPWNTAGLANGLYTLRLRVTDNLGNVGEDRMAVWVRHHDPQDLAGFPRKFDGSLESLSVAAVDLDGDNKLEVLFVDGNGEVHAVRSDGTDLPGWPVHTQPPGNLPLAQSPAFDGNPANGEVSLAWSPIIGGAAVADLDRDGRQEVVIAGTDGRVYCWHDDASMCQGFPVDADVGLSRDPYGSHDQIPNDHPEGFGATPALADLDGDGKLEIVVGSVDQKLYVWHADGTRMAPFPIQVFDVSSAPGVNDTAPRAILSSAALADVDNDGTMDIVVGTNETYSSPNYQGLTGGSGRVYRIEPNGTISPGWPAKPTSVSPDSVPLVAQGVGTSPVLADLDGNETKEIAITAFIGDAQIYAQDGSTVRTLLGTYGSAGAGSLDQDETTPEGGLANAADQPGHFYVANGAFADLDGDGNLDYLAGEVGTRILGIAVDAGTPAPFDHLFFAWDATTGQTKTNFPRVMEDWQFLNSPAVADLDGDGAPEAVASSGGFFVHAFDSTGAEPAGWPKLTGQWQTSTPAVADLDGDGNVEVIQTTRLGELFVWKTGGDACQTDEWRKFRHDEWNTGTYGVDTRRPNRITDLGATGGGTSVTLNWTAVGDDGACGTSDHYELRGSPNPITESNFGGATPLSAPTPSASGSPEQTTFDPTTDGLAFAAIRAVDEAGNAGPIQSVALPGGGGGGGEDTCPAANAIVGTQGNDVLVGTPGDDIICGLGGSDMIFGGGGRDLVFGGSGADEIHGGDGADVIRGGNGNDRLYGGPGPDTLLGNSGFDRLFGETENDLLDGGLRADTCDGGQGADRFRRCESITQ